MSTVSMAATPTLALFSKGSGITVNYTEPVSENMPFYNSIWPRPQATVGMMSDPREQGSIGKLRNRIWPALSAEADWRAAARTLRAQRDAGIVRGYDGQNAPAGRAASTLADLAPVIGPPVAGTAASPYVFPDATAIKRSRHYYQYENSEQLVYRDSLFAPIAARD